MKEIRYIGSPETFEECAIKGCCNSLDLVEYRQRMMGINKNIGSLNFMSDNDRIGMKERPMIFEGSIRIRSHKIISFNKR